MIRRKGILYFFLLSLRTSIALTQFLLILLHTVSAELSNYGNIEWEPSGSRNDLHNNIAETTFYEIIQLRPNIFPNQISSHNLWRR